MTASLDHSPADIVRQLLINLALGTDPDTQAGQAWPVFCSDEPGRPDNCITIYDTMGTSYGRSNVDGEVLGSFGFQVRVRSTTHPVGWNKGQAIQDSLSQVYWALVGIDGVDYLVKSIIRIGDVMPIGKDISGGTKRSIFTLNCQLIVRKQ